MTPGGLSVDRVGLPADPRRGKIQNSKFKIQDSRFKIQDSKFKEEQRKMLSPWPMVEPRRCREWLNAPQGKEEIENIRDAIKKSRP